MRIALLDVDGHNGHPNLALMKLSAYHKKQGDTVEWYNAIDGHYDIAYLSKVFTHTSDNLEYIHADRIEKGGTGYSLTKELPKEADLLQPDYSIYPSIDSKTAYGFLTRGCPNKCKWCIVPKKEGNVRPYMDVEEIAINGRTNLILMDNNILASDYGLQQIEKIIKLGLKVDFNQAMDARLVTPEVGKMLARVKWIKRIRFGCDTEQQIEHCEKAIELIDGAGYKGEYFFYCMLHGDIRENLSRVNHWKNRGRRYLPHCQPYLDFNSRIQNIPQWQLDMARWADRKELFRTVEFVDYEPRKGFRCKEYIA
jgi:hypothetical protein